MDVVFDLDAIYLSTRRNNVRIRKIKVADILLQPITLPVAWQYLDTTSSNSMSLAQTNDAIYFGSYFSGTFSTSPTSVKFRIDIISKESGSSLHVYVAQIDFGTSETKTIYSGAITVSSSSTLDTVMALAYVSNT